MNAEINWLTKLPVTDTKKQSIYLWDTSGKTGVLFRKEFEK